MSSGRAPKALTAAIIFCSKKSPAGKAGDIASAFPILLNIFHCGFLGQTKLLSKSVEKVISCIYYGSDRIGSLKSQRGTIYFGMRINFVS